MLKELERNGKHNSGASVALLGLNRERGGSVVTRAQLELQSERDCLTRAMAIKC